MRWRPLLTSEARGDRRFWKTFRGSSLWWMVSGRPQAGEHASALGHAGFPRGKASSRACGSSFRCEGASGCRVRSLALGCSTVPAQGTPSVLRTLTPWRTRAWRLSGPLLTRGGGLGTFQRVRRRSVGAWAVSIFRKRSACRDCDWQHGW